MSNKRIKKKKKALKELHCRKGLLLPLREKKKDIYIYIYIYIKD